MVRVGNVSLLIEGDLPMEVSDELRRALSYVVPGFEYTTTFQHAQEKAEQDGREAWDGRKTLAKWDRRGFRCTDRERLHTPNRYAGRPNWDA